MAALMEGLVKLADCPIGLFECMGELCLKTEYGNNEGRIDAYIVSSGEFFWGPSPQSIANQRACMVRPVSADRLAHSEPRPVAGEGITEREAEALRYLLNWDDTRTQVATALKTFTLDGDQKVTTKDALESLYRKAKALATHSPAPTEAGWQDTASAPKDGRDALVGCWVINRDEPEKPPVWSAWETVFDGGPLGCDGAWGDEPTHWHDMPAPPAAPSTQGGAEG